MFIFLLRNYLLVYELEHIQKSLVKKMREYKVPGGYAHFKVATSQLLFVFPKSCFLEYM